jgi:hypothetical protein
MGTVDIFIGNNLIIDFDVFTLWVNGYSGIIKLLSIDVKF